MKRQAHLTNKTVPELTEVFGSHDLAKQVVAVHQNQVEEAKEAGEQGSRGR